MEYYSFEDIKRIYVNRWRECKGKVLAGHLDEFTGKILNAITEALNTTIEGRQIVSDLHEEELRRNPLLTDQEWSTIKAQFMVFLFHQIMTECPLMKHEFALHVYDALIPTDG